MRLQSVEEAVRESSEVKAASSSKDFEILSLKDDLDALQGSNNSLTGDYCRLKEEHKVAQDELDSIKTGISLMEEQNQENLNASKSRYEEELASLQQLLNDSLRTRHQVESSLKKQLEEASAVMGKMKKEIERLDRENQLLAG